MQTIDLTKISVHRTWASHNIC